MKKSRQATPHKAPKRRLGSVFKRKEDGRWAASVTVQGQRVTRYVKPEGSDKEQERMAHTLLAKLITEVERGDLLAPKELTLSVWLDQYLKRANKGRAASTIKDRQYSARYLKAELGDVRLDKLTPARIQHWLDTALHPEPLEGRKDLTKFKGRPLSHRAKQKALMLLTSALEEAVALEHMSRNTARPVKLTKQLTRKKHTAWTQHQARVFLAANEQTAQYLLWKLALQTGARIGELLALRVTDYDDEDGTLRIERTLTASLDRSVRTTVGQTKTERSRRTIPLPTDARATITQQQERIMKLKADAGVHWKESGWLFPSEVGTLVPYDNARRAWQTAISRAQSHAQQHYQKKEADLPVITPHDIRRTFISLALRRGVKPEVVARIVGHTSPLITLRIYREIFDDEMDEAADLIADLV